MNQNIDYSPQLTVKLDRKNIDSNNVSVHISAANKYIAYVNNIRQGAKIPSAHEDTLLVVRVGGNTCDVELLIIVSETSVGPSGV